MALSDSFDLDGHLAGVSHLHPNTAASYNPSVRQFAEFLGVEYNNQKLDSGVLVDDNISKFIFYLGEKVGYKPHTLKTTMAAIGAQLVANLKSSVYDMPHLYPKTIIAVKVRFLKTILFGKPLNLSILYLF